MGSTIIKKKDGAGEKMVSHSKTKIMNILLMSW